MTRASKQLDNNY